MLGFDNKIIRISLQGNLEKSLHRNYDRFKDPEDITSKTLNTSGEFSGRSLLKYCYQVSKKIKFEILINIY